MEKVDSTRRGLGLRLKAAREAKGLTQTQVGSRFGVDKGTVSAWETGRGVPDAIRLRELARLYGVSADAILWENSISHEAMQLATEFDHLNAAEKATWRLLWLGFAARTSEAGENLPMAPEETPTAEEKRLAENTLLRPAAKKKARKAA